MELRPGQARAVEHRGAELLVSASAGSGKTSVLAQRVVRILADSDDPCDPRELLVITFTRAAAAELRSRIAGSLRDRAGDRRLARCLRLLDLAEIGTIDAWCQRLVRANFSQLGIDPSFDVLAPDAAAALRRRLRDELFDALCREESDLGRRLRGWLSRGVRVSPPQLPELVDLLHAQRDHLVNDAGWFASQAQRSRGSAEAARRAASDLALAAMRDEIRMQVEQWRQARHGAPPGARATIDGWMSEFAALTTIPAADAAALAAAIDGVGTRLSKKLADHDWIEDFRDRVIKRRLRERFKPQRVADWLGGAADCDGLLSLVFEIEALHHERLFAEKRRSGVFEFSDVQRFALDLLGTPEGSLRRPTALASRVAGRYRHILVDEYQDTSPVQVELLRLLAASGGGSAPARFMVGDVKQSIYAFREAEPRLFIAQRERLREQSGDDGVLPLVENFRSAAALLAGLNHIFCGLFDAEFGGAAFDERERLVAARGGLANPSMDDQPRIEVLVLAHPDGADAERDDADDEAVVELEEPLERIEREALVIADRLKALHGAGALVQDRGADGVPRLRPMVWSDAAILLRAARGNGPLLAQMLRRAGVPCVVRGRDSLLDSREVSDVRVVLSLLVNRRQDVPLAAYLRSPGSGLTPTELVAVRAAAGGALLDAVEAYRRSGADASLRGRLDAAVDRLARWHGFARRADVGEVVRRIVGDLELRLFAEALPFGAHRVALLDAFCAMANDFARRGDLSAFVSHLAEIERCGVVPEGDAPLREDAVTIMTIHAAKGLEFPIVVMAGAGAEFTRRPPSPALVADEAVGVGLRFADAQGPRVLESAAHDAIKVWRKRRELEEELRLLYVALTRARERLLVVGHAKPGRWEQVCADSPALSSPLSLLDRLSSSSCLDWVMRSAAVGGVCQGGLCAFGTIRVVEVDAAPVASELHVDEAEAGAPPSMAWLDEARSLLASWSDSRWSAAPAVVSVSALKSAAWGEAEDAPLTPFRVAASLGVPRFARDASDEVDGTEIGTAVHRFLQHADVCALSSETDVRRQLAQLVAEGLLDEAQAAVVPVGDLVWLSASEVGAALRGAERLERETPFVFGAPLSDGESMLVRGVIDCIAVSERGALVIDYKTDRRRDAGDWERRIRAYGAQIAAYGHVARRLLRTEIDGLALVFLREREIVRVEPVEFDFAALAAPRK